MKLLLIGIMVGVLALNAFGVDATQSWAITPTLSIEKKFDLITESHIYVVGRDGDYFNGVFNTTDSKVQRKLKKLLSTTSYEHISGWSLGSNDDPVYVIFCKKGNDRCIVSVIDNQLTYIVSVNDAVRTQKTKTVTRDREVIKYVDRVAQPETEVVRSLNRLFYDDFEAYYDAKYKD